METATGKLERSLFVFAAILLLAAGTRFAALDRFPLPVNQDELSNIYDAWSLAETGADRAGRSYPILCRGFGRPDNRPALFAWLCAPVSRFTGFSVTACRAVSAVVGTATVGLAGLWAVRVLGARAGLLTMLLLSVSPWHLLFSRLAHEGTALPGLFCAAILIGIRAAARPKHPGRSVTIPWIIAGGLVGFSTNAYGATRLSGLLFALLGSVILLSTVSRRHRGRVLLAYTVAVGLGAAPQIGAFLWDRDAFLSRAGNVVMPVSGWFDALDTFVPAILANFAPEYLFCSFGDYIVLTAGRCSIVALPFFYLGLLALMLPGTRWRAVDRSLLLGGALVCVAPSVITLTNPNPLRASGCAVLFPLLSGVGWVQAGRCLGAIPWLQRVGERGRVRMSILAGLIVLGASVTYVTRYVRSDTLPAIAQQHTLVDLGEWLKENGSGYDRVYVDPTGTNHPELYVAAFTGMTPREFQRAEVESWGKRMYIVTRLGRYYFVTPEEALRAWDASLQDERWLIVNADRSVMIRLGHSSP